MNTALAEQHLISACLMNGDAMISVADLIAPDDMSDGRNRLIWAAILDCHQRRARPEYVLVLEYLRRHDQLEIVGSEYLSSMPFAGSSGVLAYAQIIKDASTERQLAAALDASRVIACDPARTVAEKVQAVQQRVIDIAMQVGTQKEPQAIGSLIARRAERVRAGNIIVGVPTGYRDLDEISGGLPATELIICASRPGVGKSSLAKTIAMHVAQHSGPVAFFSREMSDEEIELRYTAEATGIDSSRMRRGLLRPHELDALDALARSARRVPLFIDDVAATVAAMQTRAMQVYARHGALALIVVDYIQIVQTTGRHGGTRQQELGEITRALKALAMGMRVPVLALAQLSRNVEQRADERPRLSDLREAGDLEQDANQVWFLHRTKAMHGRADLIIEKNRNGPVGDVPLIWHGPTMAYRAAAYREDSYDRD